MANEILNFIYWHQERCTFLLFLYLDKELASGLISSLEIHGYMLQMLAGTFLIVSTFESYFKANRVMYLHNILNNPLYLSFHFFFVNGGWFSTECRLRFLGARAIVVAYLDERIYFILLF